MTVPPEFTTCCSIRCPAYKSTLPGNNCGQASAKTTSGTRWRCSTNYAATKIPLIQEHLQKSIVFGVHTILPMAGMHCWVLFTLCNTTSRSAQAQWKRQVGPNAHNQPDNRLIAMKGIADIFRLTGPVDDSALFIMTAITC